MATPVFLISLRPGTFLGRFVDVVDEVSEPGAVLPLTRPGSERLAAAFGALGIDAETMVVLYDSTTGSWAARVWWLLRSVGHDRAVVLDGGLRGWKAQGCDLEAGQVVPTPTAFVARDRPEVWADQERVLAVVRGEEHDRLLNAISRRPAGLPAEFATAFTHQIPGSTAVPYPDLLDSETGALLLGDELRRLLPDVSGPGRTVVYCGSASGALLRR